MHPEIFVSSSFRMLASPTTHFVSLAQAVLYRGAVLSGLSLARFHRALAEMA